MLQKFYSPKSEPALGSYVMLSEQILGKVINCPCSQCDAWGHGGTGSRILLAIDTFPNQIWHPPADPLEQHNNVVFSRSGPCNREKWPVHINWPQDDRYPILKEIPNEKINITIFS